MSGAGYIARYRACENPRLVSVDHNSVKELAPLQRES